MTLLSNSLRTSLLLAHAVLPDASPGPGQINWLPCSEFNSTEPIQCANLTVPLDYTELELNKTLQQQLLRVRALGQPSRGSILFNFGGPSEKLSFFMKSPKVWSTLGASNFRAKSSDNTLARLWATAKLFADKCYKRNEEIGGLVGSAFEGHDEDRGLYGTLLGQTAAAMFPGRIDRMVLDGNLNPHEYYRGYDYEQWTDSDKTFSATLIDDLNDRPIPFNGTLIGYGYVKTGFTQNWNKLAATYASIGATPDAQMSIRCGDKIVRMETLDAFLPIVERQFRTSRVFGDIQTATDMVCAQWRFPAKGQYTGDFRSKTRHPILFIENTAFTPLASAQNASAGFEGSIVLQTNGYGVGSSGPSVQD
ncbi:proteinase [Colletotrichum graminicola M1.001]|uniref:Proteinase n=1 Tax=Colletotrichum graminicola (strain M1.001 / M2 / FGSC 10212) TaxID=645133 RepID=E3QQH2_COLGM|nr:proteinase [Colletotrichum graminicola M1.001]EFQ33110.1 proteinase [Colletotrichum graminicola M1.001]